MVTSSYTFYNGLFIAILFSHYDLLMNYVISTYLLDSYDWCHTEWFLSGPSKVNNSDVEIESFCPAVLCGPSEMCSHPPLDSTQDSKKGR